MTRWAKKKKVWNSNTWVFCYPTVCKSTPAVFVAQYIISSHKHRVLCVRLKTKNPGKLPIGAPLSLYTLWVNSKGGTTLTYWSVEGEGRSPVLSETRQPYTVHTCVCHAIELGRVSSVNEVRSPIVHWDFSYWFCDSVYWGL